MYNRILKCVIGVHSFFFCKRPFYMLFVIKLRYNFAIMPIFHDPFLDNDNEWEQRDDQVALLRLELGDYGYIFEHRRPDDSWTTWQPIFIDGEVDYKIHAVIERQAGSGEGFGVIWRCEDEGNCYSFEISDNGRYRIRRCTHGSWGWIKHWTPSEHIRVGETAINEILVVQLADRAKFYLNEKFVDELMFLERPLDNGFGFVVCGQQRIRIHSTIVLRHVEWEPETEATPSLDEDNIEDVLSELNEMIGMENIKQQMRTFINFLRVQKMRQERGLLTSSLNYHMVLAGPPGTGKTTVARIIGKIYKELGLLERGHLVETDRAGLVAPYVGQTALKVDSMVEKAIGGVLFIDEAYALMPVNHHNGNDFGREAIESLLKRMEDQRGRFAVIIAGYANEMHRFLEANSGVKSRFNRYFYFSHYKPDELLAIYEKMGRNAHLHLTPEAQEQLRIGFDRVCLQRNDSFGNGRFVRNLLEKTIEQQANRIVNIRPMTDDLLTTITAADIPDFDEFPVS